MKILNGGNCITTSFSMVTEMNPDDIYGILGHNAQKPIERAQIHTVCPVCDQAFPDTHVLTTLGHPQSVHVQELIELALQLGYAMTPIDLDVIANVAPGVPITFGIEVFGGNRKRFTRHLCFSQGIIEGVTNKQCGHAVAYDRGRIYDPKGLVYTFDWTHCEEMDFKPHTLWRLDKIIGN